MKQFSCGDVVPGCSAVFQGEAAEDILRQVAEHAKADHGLADVTPELEASVREKIHDAGERA